jgi:hypothetical protein
VAAIFDGGSGLAGYRTIGQSATATTPTAQGSSAWSSDSRRSARPDSCGSNVTANANSAVRARARADDALLVAVTRLTFACCGDNARRQDLLPHLALFHVRMSGSNFCTFHQ